MKEKLTKKLVLPLLALAVIGVGGTVYTLAQSGPITAHAQTAVTSTPTVQDKETQDDISSPKVSPTVKSKTDATENDKADTNSATPDGEDGN